MTLSLDTSAYSDFNRGDSRLKEWFIVDNEILISQVVIGELRAGFANGNQRGVNEQLLQKFLDSPNVRAVTLTDKTSKLYAEIYLRLRKAGTPVGTNDMWIAAMSLEHDASLLTTDTDFSYVPDLVLIKL